jgi:mycofactocin precursor
MAEPTAVAEPTPEIAEQTEDVVVEDVLVEEVSIDGMCGVY